MTWASLCFSPLQLVFQALSSASDNPPAFFLILQGTPHPRWEPVQLLLIVVGRRNRRARSLVYHFGVWRTAVLSVTVLRGIATSLFLARCMHIEARCIRRSL